MTQFSIFFKGSGIIVVGKAVPADPCASYCSNGSFISPTVLNSSSVDLNATDDAPTISAFAVAVAGSGAEGVNVLSSADIVLCDNGTITAAEDEEDVPENVMARLWAYLTIKQLLEQAEADEVTLSEDGTIVDEDNPAQRALDLALHVGQRGMYNCFSSLN